MGHRRCTPLWVACAALALSACSSTSGPSPRPSVTPSSTAAATPTATPLPPDTMTVSVVSVGVGTFDLAAIPVATLRNNARFHGAASVKVHFVTHRSDRNLGSLDSVAINLAPGQTLAVTADCTDACDGATGVSATVTVASWPTGIGAVFTTINAAYSCGPCHAGHGYGNVRGTLTPSSTIGSGSAVVGFAVCHNAAGVILGGGSEQFVWPGGASLAVVVPVIVNSTPATCSLGASTGW
jgi:hypothetical protein